LDSAEPGAMIFLAPLVAAWVAAGDTAANARLGRLDLVCSRGPSFAALAGVRFALGILAGTGVVLAATLLPAWAGEDPRLVLEWLGVVVYWAAVASWLGQWVSGAGMVLLPIATTVLSSWWVMAGAMRVLGVPAAQDPAVYVTVPLVRLGSTVPADLMEPMLILPAGVSGWCGRWRRRRWRVAWLPPSGDSFSCGKRGNKPWSSAPKVSPLPFAAALPSDRWRSA